jgi:lipoate-protein ligase A
MMIKLIYPKTTWRLIQTPAKNGAWNMALDEAILETTGRGEEPPTLRLYAWQPACLSLGYAQPVSDVNFPILQAHGWEWVRRPTGGRAILHTDELTYSVAGPGDEPRLAGGVLESYQVLAGALLRVLEILEIPAQAVEKVKNASSGANQNPVCFERPSNYEITVYGKKLIGSAQARRKEGILQHGSLPLGGDLTRIVQALNFPDQDSRLQASQRLLARAITIEQILGFPLPWEQAAQAFARAFAETLNLELVRSQPTMVELQRAQVLMQEKYANPEWGNKN